MRQVRVEDLDGRPALQRARLQGRPGRRRDSGARARGCATGPTAANRQPFRIIVVRVAGRESELARIYGRPWFTEAPLVLGVVAVPGEAWRRTDDKPCDEVDATIAMDHLVLAATALGLGTCWIAAFDPAAAREVLGLPDDVEPIAFTPLGYPDKAPAGTGRRPLDELVKRERW